MVPKENCLNYLLQGQKMQFRRETQASFVEIVHEQNAIKDIGLSKILRVFSNLYSKTFQMFLFVSLSKYL